jgi:hypothetical protein
VRRQTLLALALALLFGAAAPAQTVRQALKDLDPDQLWIYNDLEKGFAEAKKSGKPLLVAFRCVL